MEKIEERILNLIKQLEEEKRLADKRAKQLYLSGGASDKISEGDSKVEVVDLGTGYIQTLADNQQVRKDAVLGNIQPLQPAFLAFNSAVDANATGDGTVVTVDFDTEVYDQGGNFAGDVFTAPVTGKYPMKYNVSIYGLTAAHTYGRILLVTSNRTYYLNEGNPGAGRSVGGSYSFAGAIDIDMDANDTVRVNLIVSNGAKVIAIEGFSSPYSVFSGALLC